MSRRWLVAGSVVVGALALTALAAAPWWRIRRVEIWGAQLVPPHDVVAALALPPDRPLWWPLTPLVDRLRRLPLVEGVELRRRWPHTLEVHLRERRPVAWTEGQWAPLGPDGVPLPADPRLVARPLPILRGASPVERRRLARELGVWAAADPESWARVVEARPWRPRAWIAMLDDGDGRRTLVVAPYGAGPSHWRRLRWVQTEERRRGWPPGAALRVDLRWRGQAVVRLFVHCERGCVPIS
jgi:hypothetical protein